MEIWVGDKKYTHECVTTKDVCYLILYRVLQQQWRGFGNLWKAMKIK